MSSRNDTSRNDSFRNHALRSNASASPSLIASGASRGFDPKSALEKSSPAERSPSAHRAQDDDYSSPPPMTEQDLPPTNTKRWVMRRKAEVVAGVRNGLISLDDACQRYSLSMEEFLSWQRLIDSHGVRGLRATRLQDYRSGDDQEGDPDRPANTSPDD